jgi:phage tail-like protein
MATTPPQAQPPAQGQANAQTPLTASELYRNYNFLLRLDATEVRFTECLGLGMRIEPIRYRESGAGGVVRALPGPVAYAEVVLRYGLTATADLWNWLKRTSEGGVQRRNVTISQLDNDGSTPRVNWNLYGAWPCQWSGVPFDALGRETAIEELRLAFDRMDRA